MPPATARRFRPWPLLVLIGAFLLTTAPSAQRAAAPQAVDEEFARLVKEWTTKPEFLSPLVDHLPRKAGVEIGRASCRERV